MHCKRLLASSPADHAGLQIGDVLVAVDGVALDGSGSLLNAHEAHGEASGGRPDRGRYRDRDQRRRL